MAICCSSAVCVRVRVRTDLVPAGVAVLGVETLVAGAAVRPALPHDVAHAAQRRLALKATEVLHVPVPALRLRALVCKDDLRERERETETETHSCKSEGIIFFWCGKKAFALNPLLLYVYFSLPIKLFK